MPSYTYNRRFGFDDRNVTLEATRRVLDKEGPGIHERIRVGTLTFTKYAILSRGTAFIRDVSLIINFPGSPKGVKECFDVVKDTFRMRSS
jgi:molybdopterin adenylyltransferase